MKISNIQKFNTFNNHPVLKTAGNYPCKASNSNKLVQTDEFIVKNTLIGFRGIYPQFILDQCDTIHCKSEDVLKKISAPDKSVVKSFYANLVKVFKK